jgi:hypothetical protein
MNDVGKGASRKPGTVHFDLLGERYLEGDVLGMLKDLFDKDVTASMGYFTVDGQHYVEYSGAWARMKTGCPAFMEITGF